MKMRRGLACDCPAACVLSVAPAFKLPAEGERGAGALLRCMA
jgi:hypothetical protein